jgi:hemolysin activation/secretion protein
MAGVSVSHPVIRGYSESLYLTAGVDGVNSRNALLGQAVSNERTRVVRVAANYGRSSARMNTSASLAVSGGDAGHGAFTSDRQYAQPDFMKLNAQAAIDWAIGKFWVARLRAAGQYTKDPLPASEMFALGGDTFGRAFESSYAAGDAGYGASAELAYRWLNGPKFVRGSEAYGFADAGETRYNDRPGIPGRGYRLASAGAGIRADINSKAMVQIEAAKALRDDSPAHRDEWRTTASFKTLF